MRWREDEHFTSEDLAQTQDKARDQFSRTAAAYVTSVGHAKGEDVAQLVEAARQRLGSLVDRQALDVATGGGHTARALAEEGAIVTASDLTPDMLAAAETFLRGVLPAAKLRFVEAAAEELPFDSGTFEIVTCRIAAHHFADPRAFLSEAKRVLVPGGVLVLVDNIAPEDPLLGQAMNTIERLRDPSHVEAYTPSRWFSWITGARLETYSLQRIWRIKQLNSWLKRAQTSPENEATLRAFLHDAPESVLRYLIVPTDRESWTRSADSGNDIGLRHEMMILAATSDPVGLGTG